MNGIPGRLAAPLLTFSLSLALCLGLIECGLRLGSPPALSGLHESIPESPWVYALKPGAHLSDARTEYRINSDGFRDRSYARPKPANHFRIVVVGDSVTFGFGVDQEQSYTSVLEKALAPSKTPNAPTIEVLNFAVSGYGPYHESEFLKGRAPAYEPDLILVQFCINDLDDPGEHIGATAQLAMNELPAKAFPRPRVAPGFWQRICRQSRFCSWGTSLGAAAINAGVRDRPGARERADAEWRWLGARYEEMARTASELGASFAIVGLPHAGEVSRGEDKTSRRLAQTADAGGWPLFSLVPAFRAEYARGTRLYLDAWHPTAEGHKLAGQALGAELRCTGLVPRARPKGCR